VQVSVEIIEAGEFLGEKPLFRVPTVTRTGPPTVRVQDAEGRFYVTDPETAYLRHIQDEAR